MPVALRPMSQIESETRSGYQAHAEINGGAEAKTNPVNSLLPTLTRVAPTISLRLSIVAPHAVWDVPARRFECERPGG
jgi:hypothetical protein